MFKEIGPKYAGTAGGVVATLELLGAVVLPTYVVIPLCGSSDAAYFAVGGVLMLLSSVCALLITPNKM